MPWSGTAGSQTFSRATGVYNGSTCWDDSRAADRGIRSDDHDYHDQDIATGIGACLKRDGGNTASANIPMGGFKITGLGPATAAGDAVRYEQLPTGVMTTRGDMDYYGASGIQRLAKGTSGQILTMGANDPQWTTTLPSLAVSTGITIGGINPFANYTYSSQMANYLVSGGARTPTANDTYVFRDDADTTWHYTTLGTLIYYGLATLGNI